MNHMKHPNQARPLFIIGNKRSGTSPLVALLNLHPGIFISRESDIIWLLYQARFRSAPRYRSYPWDAPRGMQATLRTSHDILQQCLYGVTEEGAIRDTFFRVQKNLMKQTAAPQKPYRKTNLTWIGDKKPVQHADPEIGSFLQAHFPDARYIHIIRDPRAVVDSMMAAAKSWNYGTPEYWKTSPLEIMERWTIHEEWVLSARSLRNSPFHTLRLEDLCREPGMEMAALFDFLGLETPGELIDALPYFIDPTPNRKYMPFILPPSSRAARIMEIYGYSRSRRSMPSDPKVDSSLAAPSPEAKPMFEWLGKFDKIIVTGPQRAGTRICAQMIAHDTGHKYVDEREFGIDSLQQLGTLLQDEHCLVVHGPALCRYAHTFSSNDTAVVFMRRDVQEIIASQKRIGWDSEAIELARYDRSNGVIAEVKREFWEKHQIKRIQHAFEVEYQTLNEHPLWVPGLLRRDFSSSQTALGEETKKHLADCRKDYLQSLKQIKAVGGIRSVCLVLGPYRNLTTITSAMLFLHPSCQVLNHAAERLLPMEEVNFLQNYTESKFENFLRYAVHISQGGRMGAYGGPITLSHVFTQERIKQRYHDRYGESLIKSDIRCLLWKDSMRAANFVREKNIDLVDILSRNQKLRFLMPVRNPLDCAVSNYRNGHARHFLDLKDNKLENILDCILKEISWFLDLHKHFPDRCFYFFEDEFTEDTLLSLSDFLRLEPDKDWIEDALKCYKIKSFYMHNQEFIDHYEQSMQVYLANHSWIIEKLKRFSDRAREIYRNARPLPGPGILLRDESEENEAMLVKAPGNDKIGLNATGRLIWTLCDGARTRGEILSALEERYDDIDKNVLARDLDGFIENLVAEGFLQLSPDTGKSSIYK